MREEDQQQPVAGAEAAAGITDPTGLSQRVGALTFANSGMGFLPDGSERGRARAGATTVSRSQDHRRRVRRGRDRSRHRAWRRAPRAVRDPGKVIAELAAMVALGGDCLVDIAVLREQPA